MKKLLALVVALGLLLTISGTASAISNPTDYADGDIARGIVNSRHNLSATGVHFRADNANSVDWIDVGNGGTSEICVFCHTPHAAWDNETLWNKGVQNTANYTTYGTTVGGTSVDTTPGTATLHCLSCHDGVNTFDTIVNWPGKDTNINVNTDMGWIFTEDGNTMSDYMTSGRLNIGTDLRNDHPVSITYIEDRASLRPLPTQISSITMENDVLTVVATTSTSATTTTNLWAVGGYLDATATISQLLRSTKVECVSCHDPHFKNQSWDEVAGTWGGGDVVAGSDDMDGLFLRRVGGNSLSGVCRTCHNK